MKLFRKALILTHRYVGLVVGVLVIMWFATGIVMMYAGGMPRLTPELRLQQLAPLALEDVRLSPAEAAEAAGLPTEGGRTVLLTVMERPAYRFGGRFSTTVFADTGEQLDDLSVAQARTVASRFAGLPEDRIRHVETLDQVDQWTMGQGGPMPLYKFGVDDDVGTELYVQPQTGEVSLLTTRRSRLLAWIGTIPHWLYFAALRANQSVWYQIVVWSSAIACLLGLMGLVLAVVQFRWRGSRGAARSAAPGRLRLTDGVPYTGWMRWHYVTGAVFGVFTVTWAFSGLLSMEPFAWTNATGLEVPRSTFTGGPVELGRFSAIDAAAWRRAVGEGAIKEIELARIQDAPYYLVRQETPALPGRRERLHQPYYVTARVEPRRLVVAADTLEVHDRPFSVDSLMRRIATALPETPVVDSTLLADYDSYYYSRNRRTPLPVLRVKFDDPAETWLYVDPDTSQMLGTVHRLERVERWLYNGLHSLDFAFWYQSWTWDVGMIALSLGGLSTSVLGFWLGLGRLRRKLRRTLPATAPAHPAGAGSSPQATGARRQREATGG